MARKRPPRRTELALALFTLVQAAASGGASAQDAPPYSGKDFGGVRFSQSATRGELEFAASRVYAFDEGGCRRLVLIGDVRVKIAGYDLHAKRAAAWLQASPDGQSQQVFVLLDDFGAPAETVAGATISVQRLPVKAVIVPVGGMRLRADLVVPEAPRDSGETRADGEFMVLAEREFAKSLWRETNPAAAAASAAAAQQAASKPLLDQRMIPLRTAQRAARRDAGLPEPYIAPPPAPPVREARRPNQSNEESVTPRRSSSGESVRGGTPTSGDRARPSTDRPTAVAERPKSTETSPTPGPAPIGTTTSEAKTAASTPSSVASPAAALADGRAPIFSPRGVITISPQNLTYISGETENQLLATGGVILQYTEQMGRVLQVTAQRAVVFFEPGQGTQGTQFGADTVRGIYLEGDVQATDGRYTIRGPEIYYDVKANRAVSVDSVFWTFDEARKLPLYVRAKAIYQEASAQFTAKNAQLTNSAFFDPELAIGASSVTITRETVQEPSRGEKTAPPPTTRTLVEAEDVVTRLAGVPVFYWPFYKGDPDRFIVKDFRVENFSGSGAAVRATFDIYGLVGAKKNKRFQADLLTDFFVERGVGLGTKLGWQTDNADGSLLAWALPSDRGIDVMKPGTQLNRDGEFRGVLLAEHREKIDEKWTILAEVAVVSDEAVIDAFFEGLGETRREFTNRIAARRIDKNTLFSAEIKGSINDFVSNEYLLQSRGYSVTKAPELFYSRLADDLLRNRPGLLTYFSEYRAGYMYMNFDEVDARDHGFTNNSLAQRALGVNFDEKLGDALRARGLDEDGVFRADTRHELNATLNAGPVKLNPFVVARGTGYDREFDDYAPDQSESGRVWSAAGLRVSTTLQRVYENADSRLFDIHRLRHIIEPSATLWASGTSLESKDMPVYDERVEALADGSIVRLGVTQTFQTQRGGPGQWHNTDFLVISTDYVYSSDDTPRRGPIGRFVEYRPELSNAGEFFVTEALWRTSDTVTLTGSSVFDLDRNQQALTAVGTLVQHSPLFATLAELRYLNAQDSTIITLGARYQMTSKYDIFAGADYDVDEGGFRNTSFEVQRRFPSATFGLGLAYNDITGESSFSFVFRPSGAIGGSRISGLGSAQTTSSSGGF
ncbi:MAG: hypothetical protein ACOYN0_01775 [Phycisphaerales bacterium]